MGQRLALVEAPLPLLSPVKRNGDDGPMGWFDSQGGPFRRHGPSQLDSHIAPDSIFQAVYESGFEPVWPVSEPGPAVTPALRLVETQSGIGWASSPGEGAGTAPLVFFPGQHSMTGSTPPRKEDRFQRAAGFPDPMEGEAAGHVAGKMVGPDAPPTVVICPSRFSLLP